MAAAQAIGAPGRRQLHMQGVGSAGAKPIAQIDDQDHSNPE
jgi:hypothetical protein